jgi:hypothetical protein
MRFPGKNEKNNFLCRERAANQDEGQLELALAFVLRVG